MTPEDRWLHGEQLLRHLAEDLAYPATPDLRTSVVATLQGTRGMGHALGRPAMAAVVGVIILGMAVMLALPQPREAVGDFLGLGVRGELIESLPPPSPGQTPTAVPTVTIEQLAEPTTLGQAAATLGFQPLVVDDEHPQSVYLTSFGVFPAVIVRYERFDLWQFDTSQGSVGKGIDPGGVQVEQTTVGGELAYWVTGGPRLITLRDSAGQERSRTSRVTSSASLIWNRGPLYLRIEGDMTLDEALAIAERIR